MPPLLPPIDCLHIHLWRLSPLLEPPANYLSIDLICTLTVSHPSACMQNIVILDLLDYIAWLK